MPKEDSLIDKLIHKLALDDIQISLDEQQFVPDGDRLNQIFAEIAHQSRDNPAIFEIFCYEFHFLFETEPSFLELVLDWLNQLLALENRSSPSDAAIVAAQILFGAYASSWQAVGAELMQLLDHPDNTLRACAAYQIGKFCNLLFCRWDERWDWRDDYAEDVEDADYQNDGTWKWLFDPGVYEDYLASVQGMPAIIEIMDMIYAKEIERPGVAGAWFWTAEVGYAHDNSGEWILTTLENSPEQEPFIRYFPCNLAFLAHEIFCQDTQAIRRLIDMGRADIAVMAATDNDFKIAALEPLLIELGNSDEPLTVRLASWHLAYYYHYLHPKGAALGFVELVQHPEVDLFLLFSPPHGTETPYAAILYPQGSQQWSQAEARYWVGRIFPTTARGKRRKEMNIFVSLGSRWYEHGYVKLQAGTDDQFSHVIIGYRSNRLWNPKHLLNQYQS